MELIFEKINNITIPYELLDLLTFKDIAEIRKPIIDSNFINKYELIIQSGFKNLNERTDENILFDIHEINDISEQLRNNFIQIIEKELTSYFKKKRNAAIKGLAKNSISIGLGLLPLSSLANAGLGLSGESKAIRTNILEVYKNNKAIKDKNINFSIKQRGLEALIGKFDIADKTALIDTVRLITRTIQEKTSF